MPPIRSVSLATLPVGEHTLLAGEIDGLSTTCIVVAPGNRAQIVSTPSSALVLIAVAGCGAFQYRLDDLDHTHRAVGCCAFVPRGPCVVVADESTNGAAFYVLQLRWNLSTFEAEMFAASEKARSVYFQRLDQARKYTEAIKSANTVSRTLVPGDVVPRFATGSVTVDGPDRVAPHAHPMLEQLFLGLPGSCQTVTADETVAVLHALDLLHIPLGSTHGVTVGDGDMMNYLWFDFFRDTEGMAWLQTHKEE